MRNRFDSLSWRISGRKSFKALAAILSVFSATTAFAQSAPTGAAAARYDAEFNVWLKKEIWPQIERSSATAAA